MASPAKPFFQRAVSFAIAATGQLDPIYLMLRFTPMPALSFIRNISTQTSMKVDDRPVLSAPMRNFGQKKRLCGRAKKLGYEIGVNPHKESPRDGFRNDTSNGGIAHLGTGKNTSRQCDGTHILGHRHAVRIGKAALPLDHAVSI